jgi:hypothetical protein
MSGVVYFIRYGDTKIVKIGFAAVLEKRLVQLRVSSPESLSVETTVAGSLADEQALHRALVGHRKRGEWFNPTPLVEMIVEMAINGASVAELITFAKSPTPSDEEGLSRARKRMQYTRWVDDETVPAEWRDRYRERLQEEEALSLARQILAERAEAQGIVA